MLWNRYTIMYMQIFLRLIITALIFASDYWNLSPLYQLESSKIFYVKGHFAIVSNVSIGEPLTRRLFALTGSWCIKLSREVQLQAPYTSVCTPRPKG